MLSFECFLTSKEGENTLSWSEPRGKSYLPLHLRGGVGLGSPLAVYSMLHFKTFEVQHTGLDAFSEVPAGILSVN